MDILKDQEKREMYLKQAFIPQEIWEECVVLEDGMIFTSKANYDSWVENQSKPPVYVPTDEEKQLMLALTVADRELQMKTITEIPPTATSEDIMKKLNELINIWK